MAKPLYFFVALAAVLLSCTSTSFLEGPEAPNEIRYLAALAFEPETGRLVGSSDLVERTESWRIELEYAEGFEAIETADLELHGWTEALRPESIPASLALGRLRAALGCDTRVPPPTWTATLRGEARASWPSLSTDALANACPSLLEPGTSQSPHLCGRNFCGQSVHQSACQIEIRSAGCGLERSVLLGSVDAYGQLCFDDSESCHSQLAPSPVFRRIECSEPDPCTIDWLEPSPSNPPLRILRRELLPIAAPPPAALLAQPKDALTGPLHELLVSDTHLLALSRGELILGFGIGDYPSRLLSLDRDSLEIMTDVPLPTGLGTLEWSPDRQSIVGMLIDRTSGEHSILRLSLGGEVLERHPVQLPPGKSYAIVRPLRYLPGLDRFVAFLSDGQADTAILSFDPNTLQTLSTCVPGFGFGPTDLLLAGADELWITENAGDYLLRLSLVDCRPTGSMSMDIPGNFGMGFMLPWPEGSNRIFLTLGGISSNAVSEGALVAGETFPGRGAAFFESFMIPSQLALDPLHPGLALASVHSSQGDESARLAWFDLEAKLFRVGSVEIGPGIVARMRTRGDGVFYLLMGRTGGVVRVDTR